MQKARSPQSLATSRAFGQRVKTAREQQGLTAAQFQERLAKYGVKWDHSAVTRVESGEREPRLTEALAIADILGINLTGLITPAPEIQDYVNDVRRLMNASREALSELLRAIEQAPEVLHNDGRPESTTSTA